MFIPRRKIELGLPSHIKPSFYDISELTKYQKNEIESSISSVILDGLPEYQTQFGEIIYDYREIKKSPNSDRSEDKVIEWALVYNNNFLIIELPYTDYTYLRMACRKFLKAIGHLKGFEKDPLITYDIPHLVRQRNHTTVDKDGVVEGKTIHEWWRRKTKEGKERFRLLQKKEEKSKIINLQSDLKKPRS